MSFLFRFLATLFHMASSGKVLVFVMHQGATHRRAVYPIAEQMERMGHNVTLVYTIIIGDNTRSGKITEERQILLETKDPALISAHIKKSSREMGQFLWKSEAPGAWTYLFPWIESQKFCNHWIDQKPEEIDRILAEKWDFVLLSDLFTCCGLAITGHLKVPYAIFAPNTPVGFHSYSKNFPANPVTVPAIAMGISIEWENFIVRVKMIYQYLEELLVYFPINHVVWKSDSRIDPTVSLDWVIRNSGLSIIDFASAVDYSRPQNLDAIRIGSYCKKTRPLPKDLSDFINGDPSSLGTIFLAFGTIVNWSNAPPDKLEAFIEMFHHFPNYKFIFQYSGLAELTNLPDNVLAQKWLPQADLLAHPKVTLFVSHGGMKSVREALCSGVPLVIMPMFAEQYRNAWSLFAKGAALFVDKIRVDSHTLISAIGRVATDPAFRKNAEKLRWILMDQPINGLDLGGFWIDFSIRHNGLPVRFFSNQGKNLYFHQYFMLDVAFVSVFVGFAILIVLRFTVMTLWRKIC